MKVNLVPITTVSIGGKVFSKPPDGSGSRAASYFYRTDIDTALALVAAGLFVPAKANDARALKRLGCDQAAFYSSPLDVADFVAPTHAEIVAKAIESNDKQAMLDACHLIGIAPASSVRNLSRSLSTWLKSSEASRDS